MYTPGTNEIIRDAQRRAENLNMTFNEYVTMFLKEYFGDKYEKVERFMQKHVVYRNKISPGDEVMCWMCGHHYKIEKIVIHDSVESVQCPYCKKHTDIQVHLGIDFK